MIRRAALVALALAALPAAAGVRPAYCKSVRIGVPAAASGDDVSPAAGLVEWATSAQLLELDPSGALVPGALAEVPAPEAGARAFRLRVRPGLTDASGRPLGAAEVAARMAAVLDGRAGSPAAAWAALPVLGADALLSGRASLLAGVQVLSATELLVTLAFPLPEFPWLLATPPLALPDAGPFTLRQAARQPSELLPRNDRHHRGRPFASELSVQPVDARAAARLLEKGELDLVLRPEAAGPRTAPVAPLVVTVAVLRPERLGAPAAAAVRAALGQVDRAELARRFVRGPAEPLRTLVPPSILPGAPPDELPGPGVAASAAPVRVVLLADAHDPDHRALAERLQVKLHDRGVRASVSLSERGVRPRLAGSDWDVALLSVRVQALRPALAAAQVVHAAVSADAARRAMQALAGLADEAALAAAARLAREHELFPLVATGIRVSAGAGLQGLAPRQDGSLDPGGLWRLACEGG